MSNIRFNVSCPSCEAKIAIKSTATVGRKIECPKCKFRFVVEAPAEEPEAEGEAEAPAAKGKKDGTKKKGKKGKGEETPKKKNKAMLGAILGVLALVGLLLGGYIMFGGDGDPKPNPAPGPGVKGGAKGNATSATAPATKPTEPDKTPNTRPGVELSKVKDPSNLLPGETTAVWHLRMDDLGNTPLRDLFFDANTRALFKRSMTFETSDLEEILHALVGPNQASFVVFRTRGNYNQTDLLKNMKLAKPETIKGRQFYLVESNPFLTAVGQSLNMEALGAAGPKPKGKAKAPEKLAINLYDPQTILIGEQSIIQGFLNDLKEDGLPPFKSELTKSDTPAKPPEGTPPPATPPAPAVKKNFTSNPSYRTVDKELKKAMNFLQEEGKPLPAATFAEIVNQREVNEWLQTLPPLLAVPLTPWIQQVKVTGLTLGAFNREKVQANLYFDYLTEDDARKSAVEHVLPVVNLILPLYNLRMGDTAVVRDYTMGGAPPQMDPAVPPPPTGTDPQLPVVTDSHFDVARVDTAVTINAELFWKKGNYQNTIIANLDRAMAQLKGRMAILGGELDWSDLAVVMPKLEKNPDGFPRGTLQQEARSDRFNMPPPPEQRVSFLAELLPYLGRGNIRAGIQERKFAWYANENRPAAEAWVPEFLVPHYDQSSWRATHELAEGASLGATNYVGLSGLGLDSARFNPLDPTMAKKVGLYGYDWQSRPADVTDGLSNTIALIQVPPGYQRPWIAGGGATLMGVDDKGADPLQPFIAKGPDGKRGTYVLMADGSVRWLKEGTDPKLFKAMVTRAGGDTLEDFDKAAPKQANKKEPIGKEEVPAPKVEPKLAPAPVPMNNAQDELQGKWIVVAAEEKGNKVSEKEIASKKTTFEIKGNELTETTDGAKPRRFTLSIDANQKPAHIDLKEADGVIHAIYSTDKDELTICFGTNFSPSEPKERPQQLITGNPEERPAKGKLMFILKREKR